MYDVFMSKFLGLKGNFVKQIPTTSFYTQGRKGEAILYSDWGN